MKNARRLVSMVLVVALATDVSPGQATQRVLTRPQGTAELATALNSSVGVEVLLQAWNPLAPDDDMPRTVLDQPMGISGPLLAAWDTARQSISDPKNPASVPALLSRPGLIARGVNLYDVKLSTEPLSSITLRSASPGSLTIHWIIPRAHLDFRATTPDAIQGIGLSRDLDPKLSVQMDLDVTLGVAVSDSPGQSALQVTQTVVRVVNANVDSGNFSGDVIKAIADFCSAVASGKNLNTLIAYVLGDTNLAADPQHGGLNVAGIHGIDLRSLANARLQPLNAQIARSSVGDNLRVGTWVKAAGNGQMLSLLLAPRQLPLPPQSMAISGRVIFDSGVDTARLPPNCNSVVGKDGVVVEVQTGPRSVLDVHPYSFAAPPMARLGNIRFGGGPVSNRECSFTLSGLVSLWPNNISFPPPALATHGSFGNIGHYLQVQPNGWTSPVAMTAALSNHNLLAGAGLAYNPGVGAQQRPGAASTRPVNPGDPAYRPGVEGATWGSHYKAGPTAPGAAAVSPWGAPADRAAAQVQQ